ncbi:MAG: hypothetical protein RL095_2725 [Verrucomicrobiota bacterium]|jgi:Kef-type K+ transport system membrane component KefB
MFLAAAQHNQFLEMTFIFAGSAVMAAIFILLRQPVILAYIILGIILGPMCFNQVSPDSLETVSHFGITLLMFLLGLELPPSKVKGMAGKSALVTLFTSFAFFAVTALYMGITGSPWVEAAVVGLALMFSSTAVALKLIPTTDLHHQRLGEIMIGVLLFQDILAIISIVVLQGAGHADSGWLTIVVLLIKIFALAGGSLLAVRYGLGYLMERFSIVHEYIFIAYIAWCLLGASVASALGLSAEMGAFVAGVSLATSPATLVVAELLKPLREFFMVIFFFCVGAAFDFVFSWQSAAIAAGLVILLQIAKPLIFAFALRRVGEKPKVSLQVGNRLAQSSEFSIILGFSALAAGYISKNAFGIIQICVIASFLISTLIVTRRYHTPISDPGASHKDEA